MQNFIDTFEFDKISSSVVSYTKSEGGKLLAESLLMINKDRLASELNFLEEMMLVISRYGVLPIDFSVNTIPLIEHAKKGGILSIYEIDMIAEDVLTSIALAKFIKKIDESFKIIKEETKPFKDLTSLEKEIHRVITKSQTIDDRATKQLFEIRQKIAKTEKVLQSEIASLAVKYQDFLSDDNVTIRNGHFVIPLKTIHKNKVHGIVHDISSTGNTTFVEPSNIVELNNNLVSLKALEADEIRKILKALTNLILLQEEEILINNQIIARLDFVSAKALFGIENKGIVASLSKAQAIYLKDARHPLIDKNKVIPNSFELDEKKRIIVISGPNAGGKTVALKTVGLLIYMNQCALPIMAVDAKLGYFDNIYSDIGDSQSLSDNLSTFSAHISNLAEIINLVDSSDLVLIDELGTGTDPQEGEAIALAIIQRLETVGCLAFISSHFGSLKEYAFTSECIINASMLFDESKLAPTYIFKQGIPGKSYALDVAYFYGLDGNIIEKAKQILHKKQSTDASKLMEQIHIVALENEVAKKQLMTEKEKLAKDKKMLENDKSMLEEKRAKLLENVADEKEEIILQTEEKVNRVLKELQNPNIKIHEVIDLKKEVENLKTTVEIIDYNEPIKVGSYVSVPTLGISGKVMRITGKKALLNSESGMSFLVELNKLHRIEEPKRKNITETNIDSSIVSSLSLELNIIGLRVDEAMAKLSKYLDACLLKKFKQVRIIHGFGSGALRKATNEYLSKCKFVESSRPGNEYEGGSGATVVTFK